MGFFYVLIKIMQCFFVVVSVFLFFFAISEKDVTKNKNQKFILLGVESAGSGKKKMSLISQQ